MTEQTPEQIAEKISDDLVERYGMDLGRLTRAIAAALTAERKRSRPPLGYVRLPDGTDVKETWVADYQSAAKVIRHLRYVPAMRAYAIGLIDLEYLHLRDFVQVTVAAAESARGGGA